MVKIIKFVTVVIGVLVLSLGLTMPVTKPVSAAVGVLFDTGHQTEASDMAGYSKMTADLSLRGFSFIEDSDGNITETDLSGNHILVIIEPDIALSASEISSIQDFIAAGHGLLLMSDGLDSEGRAAVNSLLSPYNIQQSTAPTARGLYTDITSHAITSAVLQYDQDSQGGKFSTGDPPALSLIRDEAGNTLVAASEMTGRIVVVADEGTFHMDSYNKRTNEILMRNIFDWLSNINPPVADFSAPSITGQVPLNVQFTDESTGDINNWQWDFGDSTTSNEQSPSHLYDDAGEYTVSLEVAGPGGSDSEVKQGYIRVTDASGTVAEAEPAKFTTSQANIAPTQVTADREVSISLDVSNHGGTTGSYQVVLEINGNFEDSQVVDVSPGSSQKVVFNVIKMTPGTYEVSVDGHKGEFVVSASTPGLPPVSPTDGGLETPTLIAIILGSAGAGVAIFFIFRRRRRHSSNTIREIEEKYRKLLDELRKV